ncbi:hypothetical protein EVAR_33466_1 [Eumeta japonica]|uniref:Uncharacterized protein n=1 Tax=Eumeta variegata TaxID=151549 RepID=A0A4C1WGT1_EUMVA|nr:hypothetical protein EVAR_33466_1 [Eumeta japonica]
MEIYIILGMAVLIYTLVTLLLNSDCWNPDEFQKCRCEECRSLCSSAAGRALSPPVLGASCVVCAVVERSAAGGMDPLARLMEGCPPLAVPGVLGATRDARPRGALVHASLAAAPAGRGERKSRHLTGTFCLTGDTMEGIIQCLVFLKAFSVSVSIVAFGMLHQKLLLQFDIARGILKTKQTQAVLVHGLRLLSVERYIKKLKPPMYRLLFWKTVEIRRPNSYRYRSDFIEIISYFIRTFATEVRRLFALLFVANPTLGRVAAYSRSCLLTINTGSCCRLFALLFADDPTLGRVAAYSRSCLLTINTGSMLRLFALLFADDPTLGRVAAIRAPVC